MKHYKLFAAYMAKNPTHDCGQVLRYVMRASGGAADPNEVSYWWNQFQILRPLLHEAMMNRGGDPLPG